VEQSGFWHPNNGNGLGECLRGAGKLFSKRKGKAPWGRANPRRLGTEKNVGKYLDYNFAGVKSGERERKKCYYQWPSV